MLTNVSFDSETLIQSQSRRFFIHETVRGTLQSIHLFQDDDSLTRRPKKYVWEVKAPMLRLEKPTETPYLEHTQEVWVLVRSDQLTLRFR